MERENRELKLSLYKMKTKINEIVSNHKYKLTKCENVSCTHGDIKTPMFANYNITKHAEQPDDPDVTGYIKIETGVVKHRVPKSKTFDNLNDAITAANDYGRECVAVVRGNPGYTLRSGYKKNETTDKKNETTDKKVIVEIPKDVKYRDNYPHIKVWIKSWVEYEIVKKSRYVKK